MKIGFLVNETDQEKPEYTTTRLARAAAEMDHDVYYVGAGDFTYRPAGEVHVRAKQAPQPLGTREAFLDAVQSRDACDLNLADLHALMIRSDPTEELAERPWASACHIVFGHAAQNVGTLVVNDPSGLSRAANKLYLQEFPDQIRPRTLIARDEDKIKAFVDELGGDAVVKPLMGARGDSVFFVRGPDDPNLNQMLSAVRDQGYVVVQEFLEAAREGDVRFFLLDGEPLQHDGEYAAFRRRPPDDDLRSNMSAGGTAEPAEITDKELEVVAAVGPKLRDDGMFLVGLDIVGDKVVEANVETPGGLESVERFTGVDFAPVIVEALVERASR